MNYFKSFIIFSVLISHLAISQDLDLALIKNDQKMKLITKINDLKGKEINTFVSELNQIEIEVEELFLTKNKDCRGVFIFQTMNSGNEKIEKRKKLNRKERRACALKLVESKIEIQKKIYQVRTHHLLKLHEKQIETLKKSEEVSLKTLNENAKKYR